MPELHLLDIEPDKLFEQYAVSEIENVQKSIHNEIERKREELRTLVGERYRDLIEAADKIAEMKLLSEQVITDVESMTSALGLLQKKHSDNVKPKTVTKIIQGKISTTDEITAQIGLLVDLPEMIWTSIDRKDYIQAAQLFLLGRHIKTGFYVDKNLKSITPRLLVLERQWSIMAHFPSTILKAAEKELQLTDINPKDSSICLASIALLENCSLMEKFLSLRTQALQVVLQGDGDVKARILNSHSFIVNTLHALCYCFVDTPEPGKEVVWKIIQNISTKEIQTIVNFIEPSIRNKYLPPVILKYRANPISKCEPIPIQEITKSVSEWINYIKESVNKKGKALLNNITSLRSLHALTSVNIRPDGEWQFLLTNLGISEKLDLWNDLYRPLINLRAKDLISLHWNEAFIEILQHINEVLNQEDEKRNELDLRWFVWKESPGDLNLKNKKENETRGIWLKAKGISPRVANICKKFQHKLENLFDDLSALCIDDILNSDTKDLRSHQQSACLEVILKLKEFIRDLENKSDVTETKLAVVARFLQAVPELCPALQKCLTLADDNKVNAWHEAKTLLQAESISCWGHWEELTCNRLKKFIPEVIKTPTTFAELLSIIPQWDIILIEEGGEGDNLHQSQLKIPSCPSFPLQSALNMINTEVGKAHVPRLVSENVMQKLVPELLSCYPSEVLCQSQAVQYLLDVKYLQCQFVPVTNKGLTSVCLDKISQIESRIDPFDLEVSATYIQNNVKLSVQRTQSLFGCTVYHGDALNAPIKVSEDPCIVPMSKTAANVWFPPLPVTNPANRPQIMKSKATKSIGKPIPETTSSLTSTSTTEGMSRSASSSYFSWFT